MKNLLDTEASYVLNLQFLVSVWFYAVLFCFFFVPSLFSLNAINLLKNDYDYQKFLESISSSNQFWFVPINGGGQIYPSSNLSNSHSPSQLIHGILFLQTKTLALLLHLHFPCLLWSCWLPLAPHLKLQCFSQNVSIIPPQYMPRTISHHSPLHSERLSPSILTSPSSVLFFAISFEPHIALTIPLSVLLKIDISFSPKHHVSLPYNIANLTQLQ